MVRCYNCDWDGDEKDLVERSGSLIFYDHIAINAGMPDIIRTDYLCPKCNVMLRTHRSSNGMIFDQ
jgi:hypothetical protein